MLWASEIRSLLLVKAGSGDLVSRLSDPFESLFICMEPTLGFCGGAVPLHILFEIADRQKYYKIIFLLGDCNATLPYQPID